MGDLLVDGQIRVFVFLPIVLITFLMGILRHYASVLITNVKKMDLEQIRESQFLLRMNHFQENANYLTEQSFAQRSKVFIAETERILRDKKEPGSSLEQNPMDPSFMTEMIKANVTNVLPMIAIGGLINWMFSGFITTKVPFPLTLQFKSMLQRGIELTSLDASWVSSVSWYFINAFGLRSIYFLVLGENNEADQGKIVEEQMQSMANRNSNTCFKVELEAIQIMQHKWILQDVDQHLETNYEN